MTDKDQSQCDASSSEISSASEKKKILTKQKSLKKSIWSDHQLGKFLYLLRTKRQNGFFS